MMMVCDKMEDIMKKYLFKKRVVISMLIIALMLPCFSLNAAALSTYDQTFEIVGVYTSIWTHEVNDYVHPDADDEEETHRLVASVVSYGKKLVNGTNNPFTDSYIRVEGYSGRSPNIDFSWSITARTRYLYDNLNESVAQSGEASVTQANYYLNKSDPAYGPVQIAYDMGNIEFWQSIANFIDLSAEGVLTAQVTANGTYTNNQINIYVPAN
jgi:hypothetical protein